MNTFRFDPDAVARAEAAGWRAYYDRDWLRLLRLIVALSEAQFRLPFPVSWLAAGDIVRASIAWVPADHDLEAVRAHLERYYQRARRHSGLRFDPARAAALEVAYWDVHRRLVGRPDKTEFIETLTALHALLFDLPPQTARLSAEWRVAANTTVDGITGRTSADPERDWFRLEGQLQNCYRAIAAALSTRTVLVPVEEVV